ncbi:hypothetical protein CFC21_077109 [Triticum aestivum]|uniref:Uncharacterized protein n=2 Tax=Triticum aestivum TaxID=4565 RepID=A0A9R1HV51_WHEAT|nr:uncharacterized protein LOC109783996 [Aegilops tauschii subsp. strangulata]KAF7071873.1 hypothetical protein CFC21_077109 [Triticum aestivum]
MGVGGGSSASASRCRSTGATMSVAPASGGNSVRCCRCINIYLNNNVQGVTNSVLFGSSVVMRDPGASVVPSRRPPRAARVCCRRQRRQQRKKKMMKTTMWAAAAIICLAALAIIVLVLSVKRT